MPCGAVLLRAAVLPQSAVLFLYCWWFFSFFSFTNLCCLFRPLLCGLKKKIGLFVENRKIRHNPSHTTHTCSKTTAANLRVAGRRW